MSYVKIIKLKVEIACVSTEKKKTNILFYLMFTLVPLYSSTLFNLRVCVKVQQCHVIGQIQAQFISVVLSGVRGCDVMGSDALHSLSPFNRYIYIYIYICIYMCMCL